MHCLISSKPSKNLAIASIQQLVNENASTAISQEDYERRYDALQCSTKRRKGGLHGSQSKKQERAVRRKKIAEFSATLRERGSIPFTKNFEQARCTWLALLNTMLPISASRWRAPRRPLRCSASHNLRRF